MQPAPTQGGRAAAGRHWASVLTDLLELMLFDNDAAIIEMNRERFGTGVIRRG